MSLSLRIHIVDSNVTKTIVFDPSTTVYDACRIIREKCTEEHLGQSKDYGLFLPDEENKSGVWLEPARRLEYYILRNSDTLEYRKKIRTLRVKMLDGSVKTMLVDDSQIVANLMVVICAKLGITNHDEYSLVLEDVENQQENNMNYGTLTLKRKKEERERDAKMNMLRKKLHTDDEVNWLDPSKTLREQGIDENETVLLRRKFFFSDQNIDSTDPVQLNLLYVQARDAIINGTHPITQEKACEFAGIQCQIQFGNHIENKHKPGFLDLKEFLPQSYVKVKGIEKKIFAEHKKHFNLSELEAKVLYTKEARALKTYGVTFFLVKEKMKGKNKLVPRLLGVTKDSVLRLDETSKEILQTWPLTTVRRWGASPNTFTLDFGDYSDQYYSVQTTEAEQIQQIIAGYIDIILKKKQAKDHFGIEGDEGSTMFEESVAPHKATILQHESSKINKINTESVAKPAIMRAGSDGEKTFSTGVMSSAQYTTIGGQVNLGHTPPTTQQPKITSVLTEPQKALISTISATQSRIKESEINLEGKAHIPELGTDITSKKWKQVTFDTHKQNVGTHMAAMNAATAQVVTLTSGPQDEVDHNAVAGAITTIGSNLPEMTKDVKMIAALMDDTMRDKLLDATRKLCSAFSDLLKAAEPESKEPRQSLLNAASRVGEASTSVLSTIGEDTAENKELQDMLLSLAKAVANTTAALVLKAKNIASTCDDQQTQNRVIGAATQCALATSQLVACAKVIAPTLHSPACQEQLTAAVRQVAKAVDNLVQICNEASGNDELMNQLKAAAAEVTRTLNDLLNHIRLASRERIRESPQRHVDVDEIYTATVKLSEASGDASEMVKQARLLGQATSKLIQSIKGEAEKLPESDIQRRLLAAAKTLADATAKMVEAARQCASQPHNVEYQSLLRKRAEDLRDVTKVATSNGDVGYHIKETIKETTIETKPTPHFIATTEYMTRQEYTNVQESDDKKDYITTKDIVIDNTKSGATEKLQKLPTPPVPSKGTQACINAASTVSGIIGDLETTILFATAGNLNPENEHESFADHRENILKTAKALVEDTKTLVAGAASSQEQLAQVAQNSVATIVQLAEVVKFGAASLGSDNPESQVMLINAVKDVASALGDLIHATKAASGKPIYDPTMAHLKESAKVMVTNVTSLLKTVKAVEDEHTRGTRALESTVEAIGQEMRSLYSKDGCKIGVTPEDLVRCTKAITKATPKAVAAGISNKQDDIIAAANLARKSISDMLIICKSAAYNLAETQELRERTLNAGHECASQFRELLLTILHGNSQDAKHTLPVISRKIAQSTTELVAVAQLLKGSDWVDPDDPTVIAENELLGAAASIDAAAKKLASLRPRKSIKTQDLDESLNFDEMILEAAKSITYATSALVKAASAAQRELIDAGKVSRSPVSSSDDGQWSEGLISAARLVAAATHSLVESANALVQGLGSEDKLISAAKQVASSTAQLLVACKVKAEGDTEATRRLHAAGTAVIRSTDNLVRAAQQSKSVEEERCLILNKRMVGGMAQEIDARSEVFRIERELEEARNKLSAIRQAKYKLKGYDTTTSGDETDGYISSVHDGDTSRYNYQYDSSHSQYSPTHKTQNYYCNDTYSHLESPEKVNSLERNKKNKANSILQSHIDSLDNAVFGGGNNYNNYHQYDNQEYNSFIRNAPKFSGDSSDDYQDYRSDTNQPQQQTPLHQSSYYKSDTSSNQQQQQQQQQPPHHHHHQQQPQQQFTTFSPPQTKPSQRFNYDSRFVDVTPQEAASPKSTFVEYNSSPKIADTFDYSTKNLGSYQSFGKFEPPTSDGYTSSEYSTNTYKIPGGYKTDTFKYESYKSNSQPIHSTTVEKFYTSSPLYKSPTTAATTTAPPTDRNFDATFKNGSDGYQSFSSSNIEYINEPPLLKDNDTLEQKMLKKSVTQQIIEKKTVSMTKSSKQESSTKSFKFE